MTSKKYYSRFKHFHCLDLNQVSSFHQLKIWLKHKPKILDIGCGTGYLTHYLKATGIDNNAYAINQAKKLSPQTKFIKASAAQLPFKTNSFDALVCYNVLEHLSKSQKKKFFYQAKRVLKPKGLFLAGYVNETHPISQIYSFFFSKKGKADPTHQVSWTPQQFKQQISQHFHLLKLKKTSPFGKFLPFSQLFKTETLILAQN